MARRRSRTLQIRDSDNGLPYPSIRRPLRRKDIHRPRQPQLLHHQYRTHCYRMYAHTRSAGTHRQVLLTSGRSTRHHSSPTLPPLRIPKDRIGQAIPACNVAPLGRLREITSHGHRRISYQPRNPRHRIHRFGRMSCRTHRTPSRRK